MIDHWRRLFAARDLLYTWTIRELKVRYAGSFLGLAWALLYPLALLLVSMMMFTWFLRVPTAGVPAALFLYCGLVPWLFSSGTIQSSIFALFANLQLVKNAPFPREVLPLATVLVGVVDLTLSAVLLAGLIVYYRIPVGSSILLVPLLVIIQFMLTLALSLLVSAALVFYRDVRFLVPIGLQFWLYLSPVFYPLDVVPQKDRFWYLLNPFAGLIDSYRQVILFRTWPSWKPLAWIAVVAVIGLASSYAHFKRVEWEFADRI
jgi:lipopolysaccharide transport system permease protein